MKTEKKISGFLLLLFFLWIVVYLFACMLNGTWIPVYWTYEGKVFFVVFCLIAFGLVCAAYGSPD